MIPIETMEEEILKALGLIASLKKVDSYQGNMDEVVKTGIIPLPAALTVYGGASIENAAARDGARGKVKVQFSVFVIGKNLRGKKEAAADVRAILNAVRGKLNGWKYENRTLLWQTESLEIMTNLSVCAYEQLYTYTDFLIV